MATDPPRGAAPRPLDGITVVSLEHAIAAPFATRQLADLGARVIKVERPGEGDFARAYDQRVRGLKIGASVVGARAPPRLAAGKRIPGLARRQRLAVAGRGHDHGQGTGFGIEQPLGQARPRQALRQVTGGRVESGGHVRWRAEDGAV